MSLLLNNKRRRLISGGGTSDPYASNVVLYLKGDVSPIADSSNSPKTITNSGATISSTQSKYGGSSILHTTNSVIVCDTGMVIGTNPFTLECWVYKSSYASGSVFSFGLYKRDPPYLQTYSGNLYFDGNPYTAPSINNWHHLAISRQGTGTNQTHYFIDGIKQASVTQSTNHTATRLNVGNAFSGGLNGYMDSFRFTIGASRYNDNFNPETDTYLAY